MTGDANQDGNTGYLWDQDLYINIPDEPPVSPPVASFTCDKTSGYAPLTVLFTSTSTGDITSYSWSFGDGGSSSGRNPSHTFGDPGSYQVTLTVTGPGGSSTSEATEIDVTAASIPTPTAIPAVGYIIGSGTIDMSEYYARLSATPTPLPGPSATATPAPTSAVTAAPTAAASVTLTPTPVVTTIAATFPDNTCCCWISLLLLLIILIVVLYHYLKSRDKKN